MEARVTSGESRVSRLRRFFEGGGGSDGHAAASDARRLAGRLERLANVVPGLRERVALSEDVGRLEVLARGVRAAK